MGTKSATGDANEIHITGELGWSWFGDYITAKEVRQQLADLSDAEEVVVRINSPGGDASEGAAIYSLLRDAKQKVIVKIDGLAASAASVIAMAGDLVEMSDVGLLMIHDPWTIAMGDAAEMRKTAEVLDKVGDSLAAAYVQQTGKSTEDIRQMMANETWMTASEAKAHGFVDAIAGDSADVEQVVEDHHMERYRNAPKTIERFCKARRSVMRIAASAMRRPHPAMSPPAKQAPSERVPLLLRTLNLQRRRRV